MVRSTTLKGFGLRVFGAGRSRLGRMFALALMADRSAWTVVEADVAPRRVVRGHAEVAATLAPAYAPDLS